MCNVHLCTGVVVSGLSNQKRKWQCIACKQRKRHPPIAICKRIEIRETRVTASNICYTLNICTTLQYIIHIQYTYCIYSIYAIYMLYCMYICICDMQFSFSLLQKLQPRMHIRKGATLAPATIVHLFVPGCRLFWFGNKTIFKFRFRVDGWPVSLLSYYCINFVLFFSLLFKCETAIENV